MLWMILLGLASGIVSGMGIGGGAVLIPALVMFTDMEQHQIQNINLIYFIPTAIIACITHTRDKSIEYGLVWRIVIFGVLGAVLGSWIAVGMNGELLRKLFGVFLLVVGTSELLRKFETKKL